MRTPIVLLFLVCTASCLPAQQTMGILEQRASGQVVANVADENYYDNPDGTCRNMGTDGPAALPTQCFNTAIANTPSVGATFWVCKSGQAIPAPCATTNYRTIQAAFNAVGSGAIPCGSTIMIASTSDGTPTGTWNTWDETNLTYPAVACNASAWMTITTDQVSGLPPESTRISPAWLGAASLPDRPAYNQPATLGIYLPKIRNTAVSQPALSFATVNSTTAPVPSYARFIGLALMQPTAGSPQGWQSTIVESNCFTGGMVCPDHIIFDRVIVSPDDLTGTSTVLLCAGLRLTGTAMAVINSYIYEAAGHVGYCETHGIGFGNANGAVNQGPYKIFNNFIEAGAENVFTGGGHSVSTPTNIQIRRNHMYKPMELWMPGRPGYLGTPMLVKNLTEFKNALQALLEGNLFENSWYGHDANNTPLTDQFGYGVLLNSSSDLTDVHRAFVQDVTFRYNVIRHVVRGMMIDSEDCQSSKAVGCGIYPPGSTPTLIERISVHDNLFSDVSPKYFTVGTPNGPIGNGFDGSAFSAVNSLQSVPPVGILNSLTIAHNTVISNSYRQNLTVASIVASGGTATLTATNAVAIPTANQRVAVFGACSGFNNNNVTITAVTQTSPVVIFTYPSGATGTCNQGYVSTVGQAVGGVFNMTESASDSAIVRVFQAGTLAEAVMSTLPGFGFCVATGIPAGCTTQATFTVYGLTGSSACYNNNQTSATCPPNGTPATWTLVGRVHCSGTGTGTIVGNGDATPCTASGQEISAWIHPQTGLATANANAGAYYSYWLNPGPNPNPQWQHVVVSNNIFAGKVQLNHGVCQNGPTVTSNGVLTLCGVLAATGAGAYDVGCNVMAARQLIGQGNIADVLPATNVGITDMSNVGFANYNWDNLGLGVSNFADLSLDSSSQFFGGTGTGCDASQPGANIGQLQTYLAGVQ